MEVKRPLYTGQSIRLAGTGTPACASQMADDNAFSVVDLPAILDPVKIFMCFSSKFQLLGTAFGNAGWKKSCMTNQELSEYNSG